MRILLTGGSGMVGRNVLEHPAASRYDIDTPRRSELDLLDENAVHAYLRKFQPDIVIHAAGRVGGIHANMAEPVKFLSENVSMGQNIVLASRSAGVKRLLNLGSSCMYPRNIETPLSESMILQGELEPTNEGYAIAKIATQKLCSYIRRENADYKYASLIPCNLFGKYDNYAPDSSHLLAAIIHKIHCALEEGRTEVLIWGDGTARREFLFAGDLADFILRAIEKIDFLPEVLNVGLGKDYSVVEYYEMVAKAIGWEGRFDFDLEKPSGMKRKLLDVTKQEKLGWKPKTDIETAIARSYSFYLENIEDVI